MRLKIHDENESKDDDSDNFYEQEYKGNVKRSKNRVKKTIQVTRKGKSSGERPVLKAQKNSGNFTKN